MRLGAQAVKPRQPSIVSVPNPVCIVAVVAAGDQILSTRVNHAGCRAGMVASNPGDQVVDWEAANTGDSRIGLFAGVCMTPG